MLYVDCFLFALVFVILIGGVVYVIRLKEKENKNTLYLPAFVTMVGIFCSLIFTVISIIVLATGRFTLCFVFLVFALLLSTLILAGRNSGIVYDVEHFTARNFLGIKHTYSYSDITAIQGHTKDIKLFVGRRVVRLDEMYVNRKQFLAFAEAQYRKSHNGQSFMQKQKKDIFNGNVENAGEFIFVYCLLGIIVLGIIVTAWVSSRPTDPASLKYRDLRFVRMEVDRQPRGNDHLLLFAQGDEMPYRISSYMTTVRQPEEFLDSVDSGDVFTVGYETYENADKPHYGVESLTGADGKVYLTPEDVCEKWDLGDYLIFGSIGLFFAAFVVLSIVVGRHPERFSKRFVRLFFKEGYIRTNKFKQKHKR